MSRAGGEARAPLPGAAEPVFTRDFALITLGHFLMSFGFSSMLLFPMYVDALHGSRGEIGLVMAAAGLSGLLGRPAVAWALDSFGRKPVIAAGTLILAGSMALIGVVDDLGPLIYVQRVLFGVGIGALFTAYFTFAADIVPLTRRTEGIALFGVSGLIPMALNPIVGDLGFAPADLRDFYPLAAIVVAASLIPAMLVREQPRAIDAPRFTFRGALDVVASPALRPVWLATFIFSAVVATFFAFSTVTADHRDVPRPADLWFAYAGGAASVRLFGARIPDRVGPARLVAPALVCYVGALLLCAFGETHALFVVAGLLAGVGHGWCFPVLMSQVVTRSPATLRGSAVTTYTAIWVVAELGMPPVFGALADAASDAAMFLTVSGLSLVMLAFWFRIEPTFGGRATARPEPLPGPPPRV